MLTYVLYSTVRTLYGLCTVSRESLDTAWCLLLGSVLGSERTGRILQWMC